MSAFNDLAALLVTEIPLTRLQRLFEAAPKDPDAFTAGGGFCGNNCSGSTGSVCGIRCNPPAGAPDVIDREGRLALASGDLEDIRKDLPQLRRAVRDQITPHVERLKKLCN